MNHQMKTFGFAAMLMATVAVSSPAGATTLDGEIAGLLDSHPQIQSAKNSLASAGEAVRGARSGYLPQVRVTGTGGPNGLSAQGAAADTSNYNRSGQSAGASVTERLFDGNLTDSTVDSALYSQSLSEATLRATRQNAILEGVNAYLDVLRQHALLNLARENEKRLQTQLNLEDERVARGSGMAVDVLSAKHRLQIAKERRVAYEGAAEQALDRYQQVFGHAPDLQSATTPKPPLDLIPTTLTDAVRAAQTENPTVDVSQKTVTLTGERINTAESGYFPTVDLVAKTDYTNYIEASSGRRRDYALLVQANWELFSGFRTDAAVAQASYDHAASQNNASQADRKAVEAVRLAWSQLATAKERLSLLDNAVNLANEVWDARKKMRESGKETIIDVLDAESDVTNAQINYVVASYDLRVAAYQLVHDMGRLEVDTLDRSASAK